MSNSKRKTSNKIHWSIKGVLPLIAGIMILVTLAVGIIGIVGKRAEMNASIMAKDMEVIQQSVVNDLKYAPKYSYEVDGQEYSCMGAFADEKADVSTELVQIAYSQDNPAKCMVASQMEGWHMDWRTIAIFAVLLIVGIISTVEGIVNLLGGNMSIGFAEGVSSGFCSP